MAAPLPNPGHTRHQGGARLRAAADGPRSTCSPPRSCFLRGPSAGRRVALTFDDGPDPADAALPGDPGQRRGARATFFVIGRACMEHPAELEAIHRAGHQVASHGFTHTEFPRLGELGAARGAGADGVSPPPSRARGGRSCVPRAEW